MGLYVFTVSCSIVMYDMMQYNKERACAQVLLETPVERILVAGTQADARARARTRVPARRPPSLVAGTKAPTPHANAPPPLPPLSPPPPFAPAPRPSLSPSPSPPPTPYLPPPSSNSVSMMLHYLYFGPAGAAQAPVARRLRRIPRAPPPPRHRGRRRLRV